MKVTPGPITIIELTRRNLQALLAKLDQKSSVRTIYKSKTLITAVEDDAHYADREPGPMSPETEKRMKKMREV
ncbi:MAG: hypothetical protein LC723_12925 [Actinobacteria bacterium]|nr:hypothetical protein [Actinomycetota bacterium]